jgi:lipoprotein signal peptidase
MMTRRARSLIALFFCLLLADRFLKMVALGGRRVPGWPGTLSFELFRNTGIAFSLPFSGPIVWLLSVAILAAVGLMAVRDFKAKRYDRAEAVCLFVFGACSNLFDRIAYGFTVDYFIFFSRSAVNVADGMIVAGALWLIFKTKSPPSTK